MTRPPTRTSRSVVLAVLVLVVLIRHLHGPSRDAVAGTLTMLALGASWALPGYMAWGLPTAALDHRSRLARISAAGGLVLLLTYDVLRHPFESGNVVNVALVVGPLLMVALIIGLLTTHTPTPARSNVMIELDRRPAPVLAPMFAARTLVIIPTLDEAPNIATVLRRVRNAVPEADVLVVDDGSDDGTPEIVDDLAAASEGRISVARRTGPIGLGPAYQFGFRHGLDAGYEMLVEMDADLSHDPRDLPALIEAVQQGADLAIGSRYVDGGITIGWAKHREALSRMGGWYARHLLGSPVHDITSGYRAYRAELLKAMDLDSVGATGYGFQIEMTHRAEQAGARSPRSRSCSASGPPARRRCRSRSSARRCTMVPRIAVRDRHRHQPAVAHSFATGGAR